MADTKYLRVLWPPMEEEVIEETSFLNTQQEKALIRKVDWVLLPFLSLLYLYVVTHSNEWLPDIDMLSTGSASLIGAKYL
jgi:hypothetical protein